MAHVLSLLKKKRSATVLVITLIYALYKAKSHFQSQATSNGTQGSSHSNRNANSSAKRQKRGKVGVNATFFKQMRELLPICIPGNIRNKSVFDYDNGIYAFAPKN